MIFSVVSVCSVVRQQFRVDSSQFSVPSVLQMANRERAPKRGSMRLGTQIGVPGQLRPMACRLRPAGKISAGFWPFASTGGRREASSYGTMTLSHRHRDRRAASGRHENLSSRQDAESAKKTGGRCSEPLRAWRLCERQGLWVSRGHISSAQKSSRESKIRSRRAETIPSSLPEMAGLRPARGDCAKRSQFRRKFQV
jgi:hypothetical protein